MKKQTYTFLELLQDFKVLIPIIQRDYAHGRDNTRAEDVRTMLVKDLWKTVTESIKGLHLDFIYGRIDGACLIPFDGQQRLTTLFLFHRYLYEKKKGNEWHNSAEQELLKKFSYATRPSARDFCEALCEQNIVPCIADISDASWFDVSWLDDPTVKSMICVLRTIHEALESVENKDFALEKLNSITFTLADMGKLNMGDMSYISMNSTGRPLTAWENFKASLLENYPNIQEKESLDTKWADYFFKKYRSENHASYDLMMLGMIHLHLSNLERSKGKKDSYAIPSFDQIHSIPYTPFASYKSVLDKNASAIIPVFALWNALVDAETKILEAVTPLWESRLNPLIYPQNDITYADRVTYFAIILFFKYHPKCYNWGLLKSWMRIVNNLVENTTIGHANLSSHLKLIDNLAFHCLKDSTHFTSLWEKLSAYTDNDSICKERLKEEKEKAQLLLDGDKQTRDAIFNAEKLTWCKGKIFVLLQSAKENGEKLSDVCNRLEIIREYVTSSNTEKRVNFLTTTFNLLLNHYSNAEEPWKSQIAFPPDNDEQWKDEINKHPELLCKIWHKQVPKNEPSTLQNAIDSIYQKHQNIRTLALSHKQILSRYVRFWLSYDGFRIATKPSCHYQNCYYMDAYGELEALCMKGKISIGWAQRSMYTIEKKGNKFKIDKKSGDENSVITKEVSPEFLGSQTGETFEDKLNSLFNQAITEPPADYTAD